MDAGRSAETLSRVEGNHGHDQAAHSDRASTIAASGRGLPVLIIGWTEAQPDSEAGKIALVCEREPARGRSGAGAGDAALGGHGRLGA
eukprot:959843-Rhodomonas_salina.1